MHRHTYLVAFLVCSNTWLSQCVTSENSDRKDEKDLSESSYDQQITCSTVISEFDSRSVNKAFEGIECQTNDVCRRHFKLSGVDLIPYSLSREVDELLMKCCGKCVNFTEINYFNSSLEFTTSSIQSSDFVFPVLATQSTKRLYGFYYVPFINARKPVYITRQQKGRLMAFIFQLGPIIAVCLLMAILAGFIAWVIESRHNPDFPQPFISGLFQGFWWSFATMTTVGYGDKNVRSVPGKVFAVIWILLGIVGFGLLTGEMTTHILKLRSRQVDEMTNAKVGVLQNRQYEMFVASQNGGVVVMNEGTVDFYSDALGLLEKLQAQEIEGILFDMYTLISLSQMMKNANESDAAGPRWNKVRKFFLEDTVRDKKNYEGERLTYGILIKRHRDYHYFKDSIAEERLRIELSWDYNVNTMNRTDHLLSSSVEYYSFSYFNYTLYTIVSMLGVTMLYGFFYEIRRKYESYKRPPELDDAGAHALDIFTRENKN